MNAPSRKAVALFKMRCRTRAVMKPGERRIIALALCSIVLLSGPASVLAQRVGTRTTIKPNPASRAKTTTPPSRPAPPSIPSRQEQDGSITAGRIQTDGPIQVSTSEIMHDQEVRGAEVANQPRLRKPRVEPDRENLPDTPGALEASQWPLPEGFGIKRPRGSRGPAGRETTPYSPQTLGTQFNGATGPTETGAFPPDTMGAIGPTQFFVFLNGRMRTFNESTGVADGVINVDSDVFFASVMTPPMAGEVVFTSDPNVRYDRFSSRWFVTIIDVILNASTGAITRPNRILIGVSDAASNGVITPATVWTFYQFQGDATLFTDYPSLGIDPNALYIGGDMFTTAGSFNNTKGFVIPKAPLLAGSPPTVWFFSGLATGVGPGPFAPRGVDNFDPANTGPTAVGYFIGVDNATFSALMVRRVTDPGTLVLPGPTMSANILITTPLTTRFPVLVPHLGNTGGTNGRLDALDDRLYAAMIRGDNRLWTAHNIGVNNTGVAGATNNRNAARWYEIQNVNATPSVLQSGTLFDNNAINDANQRNYWIPSIAVSGQGHAALGASIAGSNERINAFTTGRLVGDTLGTLREGPGGAAIPGYTASVTPYNPPADPGGPSRRWGDYSFTSLDPQDDMTMWTIQEYCNGTNTYGVRAVKLIAPPPATPTSAAPATVPAGVASTSVVITGTSVAGSGFYDPGTNLPPPALPFNHISATVPGVIVNSVTYNNPTQVTLDISTVGSTPGPKTVTTTNPDGQALSGTATITVTGGPPATAGQVLINEFRFRGSAGAADEFVELYNNTDTTLDISGYTLWAITAAGAQNARFTAPGAIGSSTTTIPGRGHYLITGASYSLAAVASSNGTLSTGIVDGSSIGLFASDAITLPTAATRIDSAGFDTRDALFFEGTAITPSGAGTGGITVNGEYSFVRKVPVATRLPQDTNNNDNDFIFVSTTGGTFSTRASIQGAPGPENLVSPLFKTFAQITDSLLDPLLSSAATPNRVRTQRVSCPPPDSPGVICNNTHSNLGTIEIRRKFTNNTGGNVTRLRFRIVDITTANNRVPANADLRALTNSGNFMVTLSGGGGTVTVENLTLEAPSDALTNGGGMNSTIAAGTIGTGTPLIPGASINVNFMFGVQLGGSFRVFVTLEAVP